MVSEGLASVVEKVVFSYQGERDIRKAVSIAEEMEPYTCNDIYAFLSASGVVVPDLELPLIQTSHESPTDLIWTLTSDQYLFAQLRVEEISEDTLEECLRILVEKSGPTDDIFEVIDYHIELIKEAIDAGSFSVARETIQHLQGLSSFSESLQEMVSSLVAESHAYLGVAELKRGLTRDEIMEEATPGVIEQVKQSEYPLGLAAFIHFDLIPE